MITGRTPSARVSQTCRGSTKGKATALSSSSGMMQPELMTVQRTSKIHWNGVMLEDFGILPSFPKYRSRKRDSSSFTKLYLNSIGMIGHHIFQACSQLQQSRLHPSPFDGQHVSCMLSRANGTHWTYTGCSRRREQVSQVRVSLMEASLDLGNARQKVIWSRRLKIQA